MRPLGIERLLARIAGELERSGSALGIPRDAFHRPRPDLQARMPPVFGEPCALPLGPAAGPHTQLAQNIVAAWLCGARYVELKTVQIRDRLEVARPCIDVPDEGYNTEWSQELSLDDSYGEYLAARLAIEALGARLGLAGRAVFAMSVGYDLEGIRSAPVDRFISRMRDARADAASERLYEGCLEAAERLGWPVPLPAPASAASVTLSTMHGCPAGEIEAICRHLMERKRLATLVKLNPTLLGLEEATGLLRGLGWTNVEPSASAFDRDLSFGDAVAMVGRLGELAQREGVGFGVKLSNTLGVANRGGPLPGEEKYLSGRALAPLALLAASRLAAECGPGLRISYSGGASEANLRDLYAAGLWPVTVATELLKPGGYLRLAGMAGVAEEAAVAGIPERLDAEMLARLAREASSSPLYRRASRARGAARIGGALPLLDCVAAPCTAACPVGQRVPEYLRLLGEGRAADALAVVERHNELPAVTSRICDHPCTERCARIDYEGPVAIREMKRLAVERGVREAAGARPGPPAAPSGVPSADSVAVVGAGPSGLAAAAYLARRGVKVTVFERASRPGGVLASVLPSYRMPPCVTASDVERVRGLGVELCLGAEPGMSPLGLLARGWGHVYLASGAGMARELELEGDGRPLGALDFLRAWNAAASGGGRPSRERLGVGRRIAVVGGGNTAVDGARTAGRLDGVEWVGIVYRRSLEEMPADREELDSALAEGVELLTLLAPLSFSAGVLRCRRMRLGEKGPDGRRRPEPLEETVDLRCDTVIAAVGEVPDRAWLGGAGLALTEAGTVAVDSTTGETSIPGVFAGGDAVRGGGTVVLAMADAMRAAREILRRLGIEWREAGGRGEPASGRRHTLLRPAPARATDEEIARVESSRCLSCDLSCDRCVEVCPNRANVAIPVPGLRDRTQILHLEELCNECGNCATFCLYDGRPYRDKLTLFASPESFRAASGPGFAFDERGELAGLRAPGSEEAAREVARVVLDGHPWLVRRRQP